jgi:hypothetical protein
MNGRLGGPKNGATSSMLQMGFNMVSVYQIGGILFVAVGVLGSALALAWRDASRDHHELLGKD